MNEVVVWKLLKRDAGLVWKPDRAVRATVRYLENVDKPS
jgi:hypothetical protein